MIEKLIQICAYFYKDKEILKEIIEYQKEIYSFIDENLKKENFSCNEGCYYCCLGWKVNASLPEILVLIEGLNSLSIKERKSIYSKLKLYKKEKITDYTPCPLLSNNRCSVYMNRPMICRLFSSYDSKLCEKKTEFKFPEIIEQIVFKVKEKTEIIDEFFKPFFETKIYITEIKFNRQVNLFYIDMFSILKIYPKDKNIKIEIGEKFPL